MTTDADPAATDGTFSSDTDESFEVGWDDIESDSMSPRSLKKSRKWLIVSTISMASLCVYVHITCSSTGLNPDWHTAKCTQDCR